MPPTELGARRRLVRLFVAGMLCTHLLVFVTLRERIRRGYPDFTIFYTAGTILRQGLGRELYDPNVQYRVQKEFAGEIQSRRGPLPYNHPPFEALFFLPLTLLPYGQAFMVWDLLNGIALFGVALVLRRHLNALRAIPPWEFVLAFFAFFPIFASLLQGQDSILLLLLATLGFDAMKRQADFAAGCWLGLGTFKFQLVIPLVLLLVVWRRKRVGAGFLMTSLVIALVSVMVVGWEGILRYPAYVLQIARAPSLGGVPAELMPNLRGLVEGWSFHLAPVIQIGLIVAGSGALLVFAATKGGSLLPQQLELRFSLAIVVTVLVSWHTNAHDLSLLILPFVLLTYYCQSFLAKEPGRRLALLLPALPMLISPLWIVLWLASAKVNLMAIPLLLWAWEIGREISQLAPSRMEFGDGALTSIRGR